MKKLFGICIDSVSASSSVSVNATFEGYLFLDDESHWVEGIVRSSNSSSDGVDNFVYGIYFPNKIIKIYMVSPGQTEPLIFTCVRDARFYEGSFGLERELGREEKIGSCNMFTGDIVLMKEKNFPEVANIDAVQVGTDLYGAIAKFENDDAVYFHYLLSKLNLNQFAAATEREYCQVMNHRKS